MFADFYHRRPGGPGFGGMAGPMAAPMPEMAFDYPVSVQARPSLLNAFSSDDIDAAPVSSFNQNEPRTYFPETWLWQLHNIQSVCMKLFLALRPCIHFSYPAR